MKKLIYLFVIAILVSGCAMETGPRIKSAYISGAFYEGMSFDKVVKVVGRSPSTKHDIYKVSNAGGIQSITWGVRSKVTTGWDPFDSYEFKFNNKKLVDWSTKNY
ncbi:MAG: hypothetical protein NTY14_02185 [Candidatus Omnitrophica bacterium]|nr:hypothetical protein [Candidatus Omnitrophota bacterium]